jgi:hypothetical protein
LSHFFLLSGQSSVYHLSPLLLYCVHPVCMVQEGTLLDSVFHCPSVILISATLPLSATVTAPTPIIAIEPASTPVPPNEQFHAFLFAVPPLIPFGICHRHSCIMSISLRPSFPSRLLSLFGLRRFPILCKPADFRYLLA